MLTGTCTGSLGLRLRFADREWQTDGRRMGRSVAAVAIRYADSVKQHGDGK